MKPTYITTSWDDGHPMDLRVVALLAKADRRNFMRRRRRSWGRCQQPTANLSTISKSAPTPSIMSTLPACRMGRRGRRSPIPRPVG